MHYVFSPVGGDVFPYRGTYLPLQGKIAILYIDFFKLFLNNCIYLSK